MQWHFPVAALCLSLACGTVGAQEPPPAAPAEGATAPGWWNLHGQATGTLQYHPSFSAPYSGTNSLSPGNNGRETTDLTLFGGVRLWQGAAAYVNPEIDQGFGLDGTLGMAGFPSGEAYKVGARNPYFRLPRAYLRQVLPLSGDAVPVTDAANQLPGSVAEDNVTITVGKLSVVDLFDVNTYAHDPRGDFLNWSIIDAGAFDYPADAWAFTYGAVVEWTQGRWTWRNGGFALSKVPNSKDIDGQFRQFGVMSELEERHALLGRAGKLKALVFLNRGDMGRYADAVALARAQDTVPDTALVRRYASRPGAALNAEQELAGGLGLFARASANDGAQEAFEFTEINASLSAGLSLAGDRWQRPDDRAGLAVVANAISSAARRYLADGGLGILIGDGRLPDYGREKILETYYALHLHEGLVLTADLQAVANPAYNRDRGPVTIVALRLHGEF